MRTHHQWLQKLHDDIQSNADEKQAQVRNEKGPNILYAEIHQQYVSKRMYKTTGQVEVNSIEMVDTTK